MDTNERGIYLNTWHRTQECKSNSSKQRGLSGVVWCGEVVWQVASGGEVDGTGDVTRLDCTRSVRVVLTAYSHHLARSSAVLHHNNVQSSVPIVPVPIAES